MRFSVFRTSDAYRVGDRQQPCDGATKEDTHSANGRLEVEWFIEIASLDELVAFARQHGEVVITHYPELGRPSLEIVDHYRE